MIYSNLYDLARQMLDETNPYKCELDELLYTSREGDTNIEYRLLDILKETTRGHKKSVRQVNPEEVDLRFCLKAISETFYHYYEHFNSYSYAHKNLVKHQLYNWQQAIIKKYEIDKPELISELEPKADDLDKGIAIIKLLHERNGVRVKDISNELNISERAVQKSLKKLSVENDEDSYYIGGQPIKVKIDIEDDKRPPRYKTKNSMHPIVLQENIMQTADLLLALANQYIEKGSVISFVNGINIWAQLSDYAKERIKLNYCLSDMNIRAFIDEIELLPPNDSGNKLFSSERNMLHEWGGSDEELFIYHLKGANRPCNVKLKNRSDLLVNQRISIRLDNEGNPHIIIADSSGSTIEVDYSEIEYVE